MNEKDYLYERMEILEKSGLISRQVTFQMEKIMELLEELDKELEPEKVVMFMTHMAMALQRIENEQCQESLDQTALEEMKREKAYPEAKIFTEKLKKISAMEIPEAEEEFILVHLCNLFS